MRQETAGLRTRQMEHGDTRQASVEVVSCRPVPGYFWLDLPCRLLRGGSPCDHIKVRPDPSLDARGCPRYIETSHLRICLLFGRGDVSNTRLVYVSFRERGYVDRSKHRFCLACAQEKSLRYAQITVHTVKTIQRRRGFWCRHQYPRRLITSMSA